MITLNQRGTAAIEFCIVGALIFMLMFAIFDLGRYAITMQSLRLLADAGARAAMVCSASTPANVTSLINHTWPAGCTGDPLPTDTAKQNLAPFLFSGGNTPTLSTATGTSVLTVTASEPGFTMLMPFFGTTLNAPVTTATIPF